MSNGLNDFNKAESRTRVGIMIGFILATIVAGSFITSAGLSSVYMPYIKPVDHKATSLLFGIFPTFLAEEVLAYDGNVSLAENQPANTTNQTSGGVNGSIVTLPPLAQLELEDRRH